MNLGISHLCVTHAIKKYLILDFTSINKISLYVCLVQN